MVSSGVFLGAVVGCWVLQWDFGCSNEMVMDSGCSDGTLGAAVG